VLFIVSFIKTLINTVCAKYGFSQCEKQYIYLLPPFTLKYFVCESKVDAKAI